jgi:hypothetical protein
MIRVDHLGDYATFNSNQFRAGPQRLPWQAFIKWAGRNINLKLAVSPAANAADLYPSET